MMAHLTDNPPPATADTVPAPPAPDWEIYIRDYLEEDLRQAQPGDRNDLAIIAIIRDFLRLDDDKLDAAAVDQAVDKIRTYYHDAYLNEDDGAYYRSDEDHGSSDVTQAVCYNSWHVALQFPETNIRHTSLVSLIASLKKACPPTEFDPKVCMSPTCKMRNHGIKLLLESPTRLFCE
jgi:hypothetical protein